MIRRNYLKIFSFFKTDKDNSNVIFYLRTALVFCFLLGQVAFGSVVVIDPENNNQVSLINQTKFFVDSTCQSSLEDLLKPVVKWQSLADDEILNFGMTKFSYWVRLEINNKADNQYLSLGDPLINEVDFYCAKKGRVIKHSKSGASFPFEQREIKTTNYLFALPKGEFACYIRLQSDFNLQVPLQVASLDFFSRKQHHQDLALGLYFGLMLIMFFYNLFVFFSTKDKTYLYYILYILFVSLTYASFKGLTFEYLWNNKPSVNFLVPSIASIAIIFVALFSVSLLKTKKYTPRLSKFFKLFVGVFVLCIVINLLGNYELSAGLSQLFTLLFSVYLIVIGTYAYKEGAKEARFFLLAWTLYLLSIVIFILKLNGILPFNSFTSNSILYGSAIEVILLSFALADRINIYKNEKEIAQQNALETSQENEKIIREQNIVLEQKVTERTEELNKALTNLKEAQVQLVDAEKMSSLGQLTAGIAHEINNPINFVSSNISPLRQDIEDLNLILNKYGEITADSVLTEKLAEVDQLKQTLDYDYLQEELSTIINGIEDGAKRTTEIVSGLRNFSRLDEGELQKADINQGINSSLVLIKNKLKSIDLKKELAALPLIECYPGKLNQLVMNILDNSIYAVEAKKDQSNKEIAIRTFVEDNQVVLSIKDSGVGMSEETKEKIFEPFYTTKPVGEGTGLGLSITYSILKLHNASFDVKSKENQGAEFIIKIPYN